MVSIVVSAIIALVGGLLSLHYSTVIRNISDRISSCEKSSSEDNDSLDVRLRSLEEQTIRLREGHATAIAQHAAVAAQIASLSTGMDKLLQNTNDISRAVSGLTARIEHLTEHKDAE